MRAAVFGRRRVLAWLAAALVLLAGGLPGGVAGHHHESAGVHDPDCPLAALAGASERHDGLLARTPSAPCVDAVSPVTAASPDRRFRDPAADVRLRAPPAR